MLAVFRISSDSNKNNRAQTITCIPTSSRCSSHNSNSSSSTSSTYSIRQLCKDSRLRSPWPISLGSTVPLLRRPQWLKVTIPFNMEAPEVTAVSHTCNKTTLVVGLRQVLVVRLSMGRCRGTSAAPASSQTTLYNSCVSLSYF